MYSPQAGEGGLRMSRGPVIPLRLRLLFDVACDGEASAEQWAELEAILRSDEQARRLYLEYCRLHVDLHFAVRGRRAVGIVSDAIRRDALRKEKRSPVLGFLGDSARRGWGFVSDHTVLFSLLAVVLVLGSLTVLVGLSLRPKGEVGGSAPPPAARLARTSDCRWNNVAAGFSPGTELVAGQTLELAAGEAEIVFSCGAVVLLRGPSIIEIESRKAARLLVGRMSARADTAESRGFTLHTHANSVVDLGTEFHVQTAADGHSEIYVSSGAVEIRSAKNQLEHRLSAGQTAQIEPGDAGIFAVIESGDDTAAFTFPTIAPPSCTDYADASQHHATIRVAEGKLAPDSGPVELLLDGKGQSNADSPHESVFFANNQKGKVLLDLGKAVQVRKINSFSWHTCATVPVETDRYDTRATQHYNLYGYAGDHPPPSEDDLVSAGWTLISRVNTDAFFSVPPVKNRPKQQGVSIMAANGDVGRYRFLLWDVHPTHVIPFPPHSEQDQNTFFGEVDVYAE
jgi:hypothetical protein